MANSTSPRSGKASLFLFSLLTLAIIALDLWTKYLVKAHFLLFASPTEIHIYAAKTHPVFKMGDAANWVDFSLTYVRNTGAAWGFLGNLPEQIRPYFFYIITGLAILFVVYFFFKTPAHHLFSRFAICLIFAGAIGNYTDRLRLHYVVDWLHIKWNIFSWFYDYPVFNIADCSVVGGVILLFLQMIVSDIYERKKKKKIHSAE
jgi:signal peptidase II